MGSYDTFRATLLIGDMASETIDFRIEVADDSGFTTAKTTIVASTQLAASATLNDNKVLVLECRASDAKRLAPTSRFLRGRAITGGATGGSGAILVTGFVVRKGPPTPIAASRLRQFVEIAPIS